jgi:hypothetical protein
MMNSPNIVTSRALKRVQLRANADTWDVIEDGENFSGKTEFQLLFSPSGGALTISVEECKREDAPASNAAFWKDYGEGRKRMAASFAEVALPAGLHLPEGFEGYACEWAMADDGEPMTNTDIVLSGLHRGAHVSIGIGLPYEDRAAMLAELNAVLQTVSWRVV